VGAPTRLDAIVVSSARPAGNARPALDLGAMLGVPVLLMCSHGTRSDDAADNASRSGADCVVIDLTEDPARGLPAFATSEVNLPLMTTSGAITPSIAVDTDFTTSTATAPVTTLTGGVQWDVAVWDVDQWPQLTVNFAQWLSVEAIGHALALRLRVNVTASGLTNLSLFDVALFDSATFDSGLNPNVPILQINAFNSIAEFGGAI